MTDNLELFDLVTEECISCVSCGARLRSLMHKCYAILATKNLKTRERLHREVLEKNVMRYRNLIVFTFPIPPDLDYYASFIQQRYVIAPPPPIDEEEEYERYIDMLYYESVSDISEDDSS